MFTVSFLKWSFGRTEVFHNLIFSMNVSLVNDTLCVALTWYRTLIFSAAQPGVGRVQVLGSKKSLEDELLEIT